MVGRSEAEARAKAAKQTGRPGTELTLERGESVAEAEAGQICEGCWERSRFETRGPSCPRSVPRPGRPGHVVLIGAFPLFCPGLAPRGEVG